MAGSGRRSRSTRKLRPARDGALGPGGAERATREEHVPLTLDSFNLRPSSSVRNTPAPMSLDQLRASPNLVRPFESRNGKEVAPMPPDQLRPSTTLVQPFESRKEKEVGRLPVNDGVNVMDWERTGGNTNSPSGYNPGSLRAKPKVTPAQHPANLILYGLAQPKPVDPAVPKFKMKRTKPPKPKYRLVSFPYDEIRSTRPDKIPGPRESTSASAQGVSSLHIEMPIQNEPSVQKETSKQRERAMQREASMESEAYVQSVRSEGSEASVRSDTPTQNERYPQSMAYGYSEGYTQRAASPQSEGYSQSYEAPPKPRHIPHKEQFSNEEPPVPSGSTSSHPPGPSLSLGSTEPRSTYSPETDCRGDFSPAFSRGSSLGFHYSRYHSSVPTTPECDQARSRADRNGIGIRGRGISQPRPIRNAAKSAKSVKSTKRKSRLVDASSDDDDDGPLIRRSTRRRNTIADDSDSDEEHPVDECEAQPSPIHSPGIADLVKLRIRKKQMVCKKQEVSDGDSELSVLSKSPENPYGSEFETDHARTPTRANPRGDVSHSRTRRVSPSPVTWREDSEEILDVIYVNTGKPLTTSVPSRKNQSKEK